MPEHFRNTSVKIGLDLHNLSTRTDSVVRTGIQQVVFNFLEAQFHIRSKIKQSRVEFVPLPMLPKPNNSWSRFKDLMDLNVNNSAQVLKETSEELGIDLSDLWNDDAMKDSQTWSQKKFYEVVASLDWLVIIPLSEFRHVVEEAKRHNPRLRVAVLVYDLVPLIRPNLVAEGMSKWFSTAYISGIRHFADVLFTISRHTALDCMKELETILGDHIPIIAAPLPPEIPINAKENPLLLKKFSLVKNCYFICLGTIEPRKNQSLTVRGFLRFRQLFPVLSKKFKVVLIGSSGWNKEDERLAKEIDSAQGHFVFTGYLPSAEVEQLIRHANALIMPSRYEGFGLPLSLSRVLGTKVITCHNSSLPEAAGFEETYVPMNSPDSMALAMRQHASIQEISNETFMSSKTQNKDIRKEWQNILEHLSNTLSSFKQSSKLTNYNITRTPHRLKICVDLHNLSIEPNKLLKTGIQEVTFQILKSLAILRADFADLVEIISLPILPSSEYYRKEFEATCTCSPKVLQQVELEIRQKTGVSSEELWGFDLASMKYKITPMEFEQLVSDSNWFFVTSQYDIRRCYKKLRRSSPNVKISYLVYDLIPTLFPELVAKGQSSWFTYDYLRSMRNYASLAISISRATAQDLLTYTEEETIPFPIFSRILPIDQNNSLSTESKSISKHDLTPGKYFAVIGSTDPRKNTVNIIQGFSRLHQIYKGKVSELKLAIVGPKHWGSKQIETALEQANEECDIVEIGYVPDDEMHALVKHSTGVLMPSIYEGFGIPLALAQSYGIPTLTSCNSSLVEVTEANTIYAGPDNLDSLALGMYQLLQQRPIQNPPIEDDWLNYTRDLINLHLQDSNNIIPKVA